ncbi:hypothetical protein CSV75_01875 [Sporosarcina sp. P18a]|uniref:hypothetical protein n=1 Tax=Sporosarcina sp. P18a TaxID=2048259 RepID=UPI000C163242|nr:hypothetical protein [Sporosarcina sp. P18a]PIC80563.1 hypothetical protein CSV75_01875 [Sporosarcina sp. P18a]
MMTSKNEPLPQIAAKLNEKNHADLIKIIESIPRTDRSETYREALRFYYKYKDIIVTLKTLFKSS